MTLIAVGLITYLRPNLLRAALDSAAELIMPPDCRVELVVVDNDPGGSARDIVLQAQKTCPFPIQYFIEEKRGIPAARNRVIDEAKAIGAAELAFFDDDETVDPQWLVALHRCFQESGAVVIGPVLPRYEPGVPEWVKEGGFFQPALRQSGDAVSGAATGNVLYDMAWFNGLRFDERFALSGGTDILLSSQILAKGGRIIWCADAVAFENIPASRANAKWLLRRAYRVSLGLTRHKIILLGWPRTAPRILALMAATGAYGAWLLLRALFQNKSRCIKALTYFARVAGMVHGLFIGDYQEYKTVHGQ